MTTLADLQQLQNVTDISGAATFANNVSNGILFFGFTLIMFIILLLAFKRFSFAKGFMAASWIMFLLSSILWFGGFVNVIFPILYLIASVIGVIFVWLD